MIYILYKIKCREGILLSSCSVEGDERQGKASCYLEWLLEKEYKDLL